MLDLSVLKGLTPIQAPPDPLLRMKALVDLQNAKLAGADTEAQIVERRATAAKNTKAERDAERIGQILSSVKVGANGMPDASSPEMQQLFREFPQVHAALSEHYAKVGADSATAANQAGDLAVKQGTLKETQERNLFERTTKRDEIARKNAEEAAGVLVPGTEFDTTGMDGKPARAAQFRVRKPDGSYVNETRPMGTVVAAPVNPPQPEAPRSSERMRQDLQLKEAGDNAAAVDLTPAGLDAAALAFSKTGQLPPMGMGKAGVAVRSKIINRAAELTPNLDTVSNKADVAANSASLTQATKLKDALQSFENTALKNMTILESSAKRVIDSGSPMLNRPLREIDEKALGNAELPVYRAARQIVVNEVAKLTNNPNLSGQLSDSARNEISTLIPADMTLAQLLKLLPTLRQDMKNRTSSLDEQIRAIQERIKGTGAGASPAAPNSFIKPGGALDSLLNGKK